MDMEDRNRTDALECTVAAFEARLSVVEEAAAQEPVKPTDFTYELHQRVVPAIGSKNHQT